MKFELSNKAEKLLFTNVRDWYANFKPMKCVEHKKGANLTLLIDKAGPNVSIDACCEKFFCQILDKKIATC